MVALLLSLVGCEMPEHSRQELAVYVEPSGYFTPDDVMAGCAAWSVVGVTCVLAIEADADTWVRSTESSEDVHAWGGTDGLITVNVLKGNQRGTALLAVILAHELGHRLGLGHLAEGAVGVMSPHPTMPGPWLTVADLREWESR